MIIFQVRVKPQKTRKTHQKNQMKIGKSLSTLVQPNDRMLQIGKQRTVLCLLPDSPVKKLRQEKCHRRLIRIIRYGRKWIKRFRFLHTIKCCIRPIVNSIKDNGWKSTDFTAAFRERGTVTRKEALPDNSVYISTMIEVSLYFNV